MPRQSTDVLAIDDRDVAAALRFVREHAVDGIHVSDVFANASSSPSTLERRIKATLGRSIKSEITRVRLERARLLLQETDLPVAIVAVRSGFSEPKYFCEVFRKAEGVTATSYRAKYRD